MKRTQSNRENSMDGQARVIRRKALLGATILAALAASGAVHAQTSSQEPYTVRAFTPAHGDLARSGGIPAQLANEDYVQALARIVYYWGYPAIDIMTRTGQWETVKQGPGVLLGLFPGGPVNTSGCLSDYLPPPQRMVVTPNNDTMKLWGGRRRLWHLHRSHELMEVAPWSKSMI